MEKLSARQAKKPAAPSDPPYRLIRTPAELAHFAADVSPAHLLAVDLEADSMFHFQEKVCLLQMAGAGQRGVIDPLEVKHLSPLVPLFENPRICKVFHGADYDVRSLYRDFGIVINNLFDTQVATQFLGERETSLGAVINRRFGVRLDKRFQKKDWSQRPLPDAMVAYAAADVLHLIPLALQLMHELKQKGRLEWVREECDLLSRVRPPNNSAEPLFIKFRGAGRLPRRNLAALEGLLDYRRKLAARWDRPPFKVFSSAALLKIATEMADTPAAIEAARCLSPKQIRPHAEALAAIVTRAKGLHDQALPSYPRKRRPNVHPMVAERILAIKHWRDHLAQRLELDPALLFNKALMTAIAVQPPADLEALGRIDGIRNWQVTAFGRDLLKVVAARP